jgi:radical SAM superfamily enzyme YgiQ (UPF0313 family)
MKIAKLIFGGAETTLGMHIVCEAVLEAVPHAEIVDATSKGAHDADMLFVSLYWWRDVYAYLGWLHDVGIDPRKRKPLIVIGGMSAISYQPLLPYFHYAVIGDGEVVAPRLVKAIDEKKDTEGIPGLVDSRFPDLPVIIACSQGPSAKRYVDLRQSKVTRIEIARGCKARCPFCGLAFIKPYRELHSDVVGRLLLGAQTKRVALFAPDSSVHSGIEQIESFIRKYGKQNLASDMRLEMLMKRQTADRVRFGVEAFGERTRKKFHKVTTNEILLNGLMHVVNNIKTIKGSKISSGTLYLIGDLPGENNADVAQFWNVMQQFNDRLDRKFTMFVSLSSFLPTPLTPMERCAIDPWTKVNKWFADTRPHFDKLIIATRGGVVQPHARLAQALTVRGDASSSKVLNWIATKGISILGSSDERGTDKVLSACKAASFDWEKLIAYREDELPWHNIANIVPISESMRNAWVKENPANEAIQHQTQAGQSH